MSGVGNFISNIFGGGEKKQSSAPAPVAPRVDVEAPASDKERLIRTGRASLISTGSLGLLGNATTGRKQLSV